MLTSSAGFCTVSSTRKLIIVYISIIDSILLKVQPWLTLDGKTFFVWFYILYVTFGDGGHKLHAV